MARRVHRVPLGWGRVERRGFRSTEETARLASSKGSVPWPATAHPCISRNPALRLSCQADKGSIVRHHTRSRSLCPKLVAHLLDLRGLRFEGCREGLNFVLLLRTVSLLRSRRLVFTCSSTLRCSFRNSLSNIAFTAS